MAHGLTCWKCNASLEELSLPLRRLDACKVCNSELHVCRMCVEYDTRIAKHCREPTAEEVRDKTQANFCDHFKPKPGAYVAPNIAEVDASRAALDALLGKSEMTVARGMLRPVGKALLAGVLAGGSVALIAAGAGTLFVNDDPEKVVRSVVLILAFLSGTVTAGFFAARLNPVQPFATALLAAIAFEATLLIVARPGLSLRALVIAMLCAALFGFSGALIGKPGKSA